MKIIYSCEPITPSIFLGGLSTSEPQVNSWRQAALKLLNDKGFDGIVYVPELRCKVAIRELEEQSRWERITIKDSSVVLMMVPPIEPITSFDLGPYVQARKLILVYPTLESTHFEKLKERVNVPIFNTLDEAVSVSIMVTWSNNSYK